MLLPRQPLFGETSSSASLANQGDDSSKVYRSAYFLGRGDTGIAIADDEDAIFYNPAGIALGKGIYKKTVLVSPQIHMSQASRDIARRLGAENADAVDTVLSAVGKPNHVGASNFSGILFRRAALGVVTNTNADVLAYKDPEKGGLEVIKVNVDQTTGGTFTLAESFGKGRFFAGVTGKYLVRTKGQIEASAAEANTVKDKLSNTSDFVGAGSGGGADLGLMFQSGGRMNTAFGITINDVGNTRIVPQEPTELDLDLKQTINLGVAIEPGTKTSKLRLLADYRDAAGNVIKNPYKRVHLGTELTVFDAVGATGGLNQGYGTAGLYLDLYIMRFDLGFYTEEVGNRAGTRPDTRYFFQFKAGF